MKLSLIPVLLMTCTLCAYAHRLTGQELLDRKISLNLQQEEMKKVITEIERTTKVKFVYSPEMIASSRKVTVEADNAPLYKVLIDLLGPLDLKYEVESNYIILSRRDSRDTTGRGPAQRIVAGFLAKVTGKVTDTEGHPLPGVSVISKENRKLGTVTTPDGTFSLAITPDDKTLLFTSVGYQEQEIAINGRGTINIRLEAAVNSLNDVVVVGYGNQKRTTLTGSVSTVSSKTFQDRGPIPNPLSALQGQVPGVVVTRTTAMPGKENWQFQIRGASSVNNVDPLVIVDGLPYVSLNALNSINPNDIESISILKDASAAIYGARAGGGVVLITTKKAKTGKPVIEYNGSVSVKKIGLMPRLMAVPHWANMMKQGLENDQNTSNNIWYNMAQAALNRPDSMWYSRADYPYKNDFTDVKDFVFFNGTMQDILYGNATSTEHQLSVSGRSEKAGYRISLGYLGDGSLLQWGHNSNKRYNVRLANDYQFSRRLKLETNISLEKNDVVQPTRLGEVLANYTQPGFPVSTKDGKPYIWGSGSGNAGPNWMAQLGGDTWDYNTRVNSILNLTYNILPGLKAVGAASYYYGLTNTTIQENTINWYDYTGTQMLATLPTRSSYQETQIKDAYFNLNGYLEYNRTFNAVHDMRIMAGAQYERDELKNFNGKTFDLISGVPPSLGLGIGDPTSKSVGETKSHWALAGYFSRLNYAYKDKYLFEANFRYDGSSRFVADNRWKFFYGFSGGWILSQENFMKGISFLNYLKLRASWGAVGNQSGINLYDYINLLNLNFSTGPGSSNQPIIGSSPVVRVSPGNLVALDRTWEKVQTSNAGLDFAFLNSRLSGTFEYFIKENKNMLIARTYPAVLGATAPAGNNGRLRTWGWEASLQWKDNIGDLTYSIGANIADNRNKLVDFGGQKVISAANGGYNATVEGYPIGSYFGLQYAGRIQDQKTLDAYKQLLFANGSNIAAGLNANSTDPKSSLQLGDNMFKDVNGDGKITFPEDAVFLGTDIPRYSYSFNAGLQWKGFDLNVIFQGVGKRTLSRTNSWRMPLATLYQGQNDAFYEQWWTPERTGARLPRLSGTGAINNYNYQTSDWYVENGAYMRLKNLVIGYTIPQQLTQRARIQRLRVYFSGNDLWEITHIHDGWDPETTRSVSGAERFPFYRYLTFGINATL